MTIFYRSWILALLVTIPGGVYSQSPTTVPSMVPTSSLVEGVDTSPTMTVLTTTSSEVPSSVPVQQEVDAPIQGQQSSPSSTPSLSSVPVAPIPPVAPVPVTAVPPVAPVPVTPVPPPSVNVVSDLCELNEACAAFNLTGKCCPTIDDQYLYCCNGPIEPTCQRNDKCAALGLEGACCPTAGNIPSDLDGIYLDCCTTVPDTCATKNQTKGASPDVMPDNATVATDPPTSCVRMAAVEYKQALSEYNSNSAAASRSVIMTIVTVLAVVTATML
jgi:hypothetical protein